MASPAIYHGTPMTPRAMLRAAAGRAMCVSFWRPDDVGVVEAISPAIMFRQRRILRVAGCDRSRRRLVHPRRLDAVLRLARSAVVSAWPLGGHPRCARRAEPTQRQLAPAMAVRAIQGRAALAHGRATRAVAESLRAIRPGLHWMDRAGRRAGLRGVVSAHGRGRGSVAPDVRPTLACHPHDARRPGCAGIPFQQRGREQRRAERTSL